MDGTRDEVFAHPALAAQQHSGVGGRDAFDGGQHLLHFRTDGDDVGMAVLLSKGFAKRAILLAQAGVIEFLVHHHSHFGERERLEHVVAGAGFHRLNRCFHRPERGHDDDGQRGILLFGGVQKFEPADPRKFEVGEHEVNGFGGEQLQPSLGVAGGERFEAVVAQVQFEQASHLGLVFDDEDRRHDLSRLVDRAVFAGSPSRSWPGIGLLRIALIERKKDNE